MSARRHWDGSWLFGAVTIVECSGEPSSAGTVTIEAPTPGSVRAAVHATVTQDDRSMSLKITMRGRWLGADCGALELGSSAGRIRPRDAVLPPDSLCYTR